MSNTSARCVEGKHGEKAGVKDGRRRRRTLAAIEEDGNSSIREPFDT